MILDEEESRPSLIPLHYPFLEGFVIRDPEHSTETYENPIRWLVYMDGRLDLDKPTSPFL